MPKKPDRRSRSFGRKELGVLLTVIVLVGGMALFLGTAYRNKSGASFFPPTPAPPAVGDDFCKSVFYPTYATTGASGARFSAKVSYQAAGIAPVNLGDPSFTSGSMTLYMSHDFIAKKGGPAAFTFIDSNGLTVSACKLDSKTLTFSPSHNVFPVSYTEQNFISLDKNPAMINGVPGYVSLRMYYPSAQTSPSAITCVPVLDEPRYSADPAYHLSPNDDSGCMQRLTIDLWDSQGNLLPTTYNSDPSIATFSNGTKSVTSHSADFDTYSYTTSTSEESPAYYRSTNIRVPVIQESFITNY